MDIKTLEANARALVAPGKGILAADESTATIKKRFDAIDVESTEDNRRAYRDLLFTADGIGEYISGVILFDETIRQTSLEGDIPFPKVLESQGVIPGIKVDSGAKPLALADPDEAVTEGLDGLRDRFAEYHALGARFAKWRATYTITDDLPSPYAIDVNAHALARYAALAQEAGIVPIVEPEVYMEGAHTIQRSKDVTRAVQEALYRALDDQRVHLPGTLLKPNMVLSGYEAAQQASVEEVAAESIDCYRWTVPAAVPGIVFLSGGQSDEDATAHLSAMNRLGPHPWQLSFSYGRALQAAAQHAWRGDAANRAAAQQAFLHRARLNSLARSGEYTPSMEQAA
jgi:fructose-bisphosphate aldolase, class I